MSLLEVQHLSVEFTVKRGLLRRSRTTLRAVQDASLNVGRGETVGLVGESGCGKTTLSRAILRLIPASSGRVLLEGRDLLKLGSRELRQCRRKIQMVFQDPVSSLNPIRRIEDIVGEALDVHHLARTRGERRAMVTGLLEQVGLEASALARYPREFSGGQRQRIGIARALAVNPEVLVCDEPVSALDVSVQAQILSLLNELRRTRGLGCLFIAHDLAAVAQVSGRVLVMYLGRIVEEAPVAELISSPKHPYTRALLAAAPDLERRPAARGHSLPGELPSPLTPPPGCPFHPRCPLAQPVCRESLPPLRELGPGRRAACHFAEE